MKFKYQKIFILVSLIVMCGCFFLFTLRPGSREQNGGDSEQADKPLIEKTEEADFLNLFRNYYAAAIAGDMSEMEDCVSNINMVDVDEMNRRFQYVEGMENLSCHVASGVGSDMYVVYVYGEMKIKGIATTAPTLSVFLVTRAYDGKLIVYLNAVSEAEVQNMEQLNESEEVDELIRQVNDSLARRMEEDSTLKEFVERLQ